MVTTFDFPCDICGSHEAIEIASARKYTEGAPLHVCGNCGFVYVRSRRSAASIADSWTHDIFGSTYTARIPAVKARQTYVAEFIDTTVGLRGKQVCDVGGGEGLFLDMICAPDYGATVFAIEPSRQYCDAMSARGIECFAGTIEDYLASPRARRGQFDVVTIMWTLENCQSCKVMLDGAYDLLKPGGHVVVSTGSRILVPFKKPLQYYLGTTPADTHAFRFSANTLRGALAGSSLEVTHINRFIDNDILCVIARPVERGRPIAWNKDDPKAVLDFFARWHRETEDHYAKA